MAMPVSFGPTPAQLALLERRECKSLFSEDGLHNFRIEGTPRSEMTYRACRHPGCFYREERGVGALYGSPEPETIYSRVSRLERELAAMKAS